MPLIDIIKYQINMHCFLNEIRVSPAQLDCLGLLGLYGEINMSDFCAEVVSEEIFGNVQTTRNFITKCVKSGSFGACCVIEGVLFSCEYRISHGLLLREAKLAICCVTCFSIMQHLPE